MNEIKLSDYLKTHSQEETATVMRISQGSVSKMVRAERDIRLVFRDDGAFSHYAELKIKSANDGEAA